MYHNFLVFTDGVPVEVHRFKNATVENFFIYSPPVREKPYLFKAGKHSEHIYAVLFKMTAEDKSDYNNHSVWADRIPRRLKPTLALLNLIFEKDRADYARLIYDVNTLLADDIVLVTNKGVRGIRTLNFLDSAYKADTVVAINEDREGSIYFMNSFNHHLTEMKLPKDEAYANACASGVLGSDLVAVTPRWWTKAVEQYGTTENPVVPTTTK